MTTGLPTLLNIAGIHWEIVPGEDFDIDYENQIITYVPSGTNDFVVPRILGKIFEVMMKDAGIINDSTKKISVNKDQMVNFLQNTMYRFLRNNDINWKVVTNKKPRAAITDGRENREESDFFEQVMSSLRKVKTHDVEQKEETAEAEVIVKYDNERLEDISRQIDEIASTPFHDNVPYSNNRYGNNQTEEND